MNEVGQSQAEVPGWAAKVLRLAGELASREIPHAFGGAIALNYHREPRSTLDIDVNIFLTVASAGDLVDALGHLFEVDEPGQLARELGEHGQARTMWAGTYVDLFLSNTDFHTAMFERLQHQPFGDRQIPVLSIEDLLICKVLYDRGKDWVDIEAVAATRQAELDYGYMVGWLSEFIDAADPRHARLADLKRLR